VTESFRGARLPVTGDLLRHAIALVPAGKPVAEPHRPGMGCSIEWGGYKRSW